MRIALPWKAVERAGWNPRAVGFTRGFFEAARRPRGRAWPPTSATPGVGRHGSASASLVTAGVRPLNQRAARPVVRRRAYLPYADHRTAPTTPDRRNLVPTPGEPTPPTRLAPSVARTPPPAAVATGGWAVGMLMATTPCSARDAQRILATAADLADVAPQDLAAALTATSYGTELPARLERAVRRAVETARTRGRAAGPRGAVMAPNPARTEEVLTRLRGCQARLAASPQDPAAIRAMDDTAYTLCVLMGRPSAHEAISAAEEQLATAG